MGPFLASFGPFFLVFLTIILENSSILGNKCDEDVFYEPYVRVLRKKNGAPISELRASGFLDLRFKNRALLCINGAVIIYSDVERVDPESRLTPGADKTMDSLRDAPDARNADPGHLVSSVNDHYEEDLKYKGASLEVYNHQCISINKVPTDILKKMKADQGKAEPEIMPDTQVMGNRTVLGVYLIGNKEGHNKPELAWFKGPEWEYLRTKEKTVKDASFVMIMSNTPHCMRLPDGTSIKITADPRGASATTPHEVCKWTVKEENKPWYSKLFQRGFDNNGARTGEPIMEENDYQFFDCPDGDSDTAIILQMSKTTPAPVSHVNHTEFDPFALFNPNLMTPHGFRKDTGGMSGGDARPEDRDSLSGDSTSAALLCTLTPFDPACSDSGDMGGDGDEETPTLRDMQNVVAVSANNYEVLVGECLPLPQFDMGDCNGNGHNHCRLLELALELEAERPKVPIVNHLSYTADEKKVFPDYTELGGFKDLKWKDDIINLVADVFAQLCMPFRADMPYTIGRVFGWYVMKAHYYGVNMGRAPPPPPPGTPTPPPPPGVPELKPGERHVDAPDTYPPFNDADFERVKNKTDTWVILEKELQRCVDVAKKENGGKGLKFQWEVGGDKTGRWRVPFANGMERKKRSTKGPRRFPVPRVVQPEYASKRKAKRNPAFDKGWEEFEFPTWEEPLGNDINEQNSDSDLENETVSRQKRSAKVSNKYILPGKSMSISYSEGTSGYAREAIQEYRPKPDLNDPRSDAKKYMESPENLQHCWDPIEDPINKGQISCARTEDIFFYEDRAEIDYELNIAIDLWWKIWATVIGYCNKAYFSRKSETFPRLYNSKYEYFFDLVLREWKTPEDNEDLRIIFSEYLTEESQIWLDTCLESSYINSNSKSYRPPRPMTVLDKQTGKEISNYFEELPSFIYYRYHPQPSAGA